MGDSNMVDQMRWASQNGDIDKVKELLAKGVQVNLDLGKQRTPLHVAADYGQTEVLELLLAKGANINAKDSHGITALLSTIWENHISSAKLLLEKGANPNDHAPDGKSYFEAAESDETRKLLKECGAKE